MLAITWVRSTFLGRVYATQGRNHAFQSSYPPCVSSNGTEKMLGEALHSAIWGCVEQRCFASKACSCCIAPLQAILLPWPYTVVSFYLSNLAYALSLTVYMTGAQSFALVFNFLWCREVHGPASSCFPLSPASSGELSYITTITD